MPKYWSASNTTVATPWKTRLWDHLKKGRKQRLYGSLKDPCRGRGRLGGCGRYVTCLLRDVHCAGCCWRSTVSAPVIVIAGAPPGAASHCLVLRDPSVRSKTSFAGLAATRDVRIVNRALRFERRTVS